MNTPRHFLTLNDLSSDELLAVLRRASELKQMQRNGIPHASLTGESDGHDFRQSIDTNARFF